MASITLAKESAKERRAPAPQPFPRHPEDIYRARRLLQHASSCHLPDEILKPILFYASYDCIHFIASSKEPTIVQSEGPATLPEIHIETEPLRYLRPSDSTSDQSHAARHSKIRKIELHALANDQGWIPNEQDKDRERSSWLELHSRPRAQGQTRPGPRWGSNTVAYWYWTAHNLVVYASEKKLDAEADDDVSSQIKAFVRELRNGDAVSIVPKAMHDF